MTAVAVSIHLHDDSIISVGCRAGEHGAYSRISLAAETYLYVDTPAQADALIRAACQAKDYLADRARQDRLDADKALEALRARLDGSIPDPDPEPGFDVAGGAGGDLLAIPPNRTGENITTTGGVL